jgi:hypothetical protein
VQICTELMVHTLIEEEIFYPACKGHVEQRLLEEAQVEHDGAKTLIIEIGAGSPAYQFFDATAKVLSEEIKHHVREEEKSDGVLAKAKEAGVATPDLAKQMAALKQELMEQAKAGTLGPPVARSFRVRTNVGTKQLSQKHNMARGSSATMERERDESGRFVRDGDDDRDYRRRSSSRSRYDDDDRRSMPARDDEGRFTSSRSRYDDDDDDRRGSRGHGGWYGVRRRHGCGSWLDRLAEAQPRAHTLCHAFIDMQQVRNHAFAHRWCVNLAKLENQSRDDMILLGLGLAQKEHPRLAVVVGKGLGSDAHRVTVFRSRQPGKPAGRIGPRRFRSERVGLVADAAFRDPHPHMPVALQIGPPAFRLVDRDLVEIRSAEPGELSI